MTIIHTEHDRQSSQIRHLIEASRSADPFEGLGSFVPQPVSEADLMRDRIAQLEAAMRMAHDRLCPVKKATKKVLEDQIDGAREEIARVLEG